MRYFCLPTRIYFIAGLILIAGCQSRKGKQFSNTSTAIHQSFNKLDNRQKLRAWQFIPLGSSYKKVKANVDSLSNIQPEGGISALGDEGLTEAKTKIMFKQYPSEVEFNFKNDSLYSCYFTINELKQKEILDLHREIRSVYDTLFGSAEEEHQRNGGYEAHTFYWHKGTDLNANMTLSATGEKFRLSWGYQRPQR